MPGPTQSDFEFVCSGSTATCSMWATSAGGITTVVLLGTVQVGQLAAWVAEDCPPRTLVIQGGPHWFAKEDGSDIPEYMAAFMKRAFEVAIQRFKLNRVHVIAESQAAPGAVGLFLQPAFRKHLSHLTLLQPLGLNAQAFAGTAEQRVRTFRRRIAANARYQLLPLVTDPRLRHNHRFLNKMASLRTAKARAQYNSGLLHDGSNDLARLYAHTKHIAIVCGANDKLFPPAEIATTLARRHIAMPVITVPGVPHSPLATKLGQRLLRQAFRVPYAWPET